MEEDRPKLLIVDDEHNTREAMARYLGRRYRVTTAADGGDALEELAAQKFDLVLTDLRMPKHDGMEVLHAVLAQPDPPACVLLTAYGSIEDAVSAVKQGAFDFVTKPVKLDKLESVVRAALDERRKRSVEAPRAELVEMPEPEPEIHAPALPEPHRPVALAPEYVLPEPTEDGRDPMAEVMRLVNTVAPTRSTVLLTGESGTGKEVIARLLHERSGRRGEFVAVHCAALTSTLLESELFGYEKGAFTGAQERHIGRFEAADGGTIFLDEIGEIDAATQVKLLRVLESRSFERVGGTETVKVDVRLISATNRDLRKMVMENRFREDLFYRLSVVNIPLPPLRERREEIPQLVARFAAEFARENNRPVTGISPEALRALINYPWPGNIRELRNCIESMVVLARGPLLEVRDLPASVRHPETAGELLPPDMATRPPAEKPLKLDENERILIDEALRKCNGNRTAAAKLLGISRRTLHRKLAK
ncbi:sigma-54 dependent transcriptional regulator [uncultured Victivallis sp.]|uniref:sigma-54-dependent transcriptional regulator n=1 Tax=uncultured Victivallis sp. TaxID=354118 RepID=UPI0025EBB066|nr:sigma-54 dependent transcriptional regulator [uncultured Victivallis sp.]